MTHATHDRLERDLGALTTWEGAPSALWERALGEEPAAGRGGAARGRRRWWLVAGSAAVLVMVLMVGVMVPALGTARSSARMSSPSTASVDAYFTSPQMRKEAGAELLSGRQASSLISDASTIGTVPAASSVPQPSSPQTEVAPVRQVIRRAQMDLKVADVQVAFSKAAFLLSEARGEFVEESSLTGQAPQLTGTLRLRVASSRLGEVLTSLRGLGEVMGESSTGEDVTDQVVDVEARIRNEQRVEAELLALLESRRGAPLNEVLQVRASLSTVRDSIERLTAQRDRLSRLVSLSTILVTMQTDVAEPTTAANGLMDRLGESLREAWESGAEALIDSLAFIVRVFIGGLLWWIVLGVIAIAARLMWMRHVRGLAREPAPRGV